MSPIRDVDRSVLADRDGVYGVEFVGTRVGWIDRGLAPIHDEIVVGVNLRDAGSDVAVADEVGSVRQPGNVRRARKVVRSASGHAPLSMREH